MKDKHLINTAKMGMGSAVGRVMMMALIFLVITLAYGNKLTCAHDGYGAFLLTSVFSGRFMRVIKFDSLYYEEVSQINKRTLGF